MSLISICIPFYKNLVYLERLLESIAQQTFRDFNVILTDDGNEAAIVEIIKVYEKEFPINYYKNEPSLGTPSNWNFAISKASGKWIKIMHNDDWFAANHALQTFYDTIQQHPGVDFFYAAFKNVEEDSGISTVVKMSFLDKFIFQKSPYHLLKKVYVGNPSCTLVRNNLNIWYDSRYKFIVDFEYYIRVIQQTGMPFYIDEVLVNIGFHAEQVTSYTKYNPAVQIPENIIFLNEQKKDILKNVLVFDYYWRLMRNLEINNEAQLYSFLDGNVKPKSGILAMVNFQKNIPAPVLKTGLFSKFFMLIAFGINYLKN